VRRAALISGVLLLPVFGLSGPQAVERQGIDGKPLKTVDRVDLERYLGIWYETAKIPNWFQRKCARNTTAEYSRRADGQIEVLNRCLDHSGKTETARGVARIVDPASNAKLEVSFVDLFGWRLFWGDYWIIGLGREYQYAVVGTPNRRYGWILSRKPDLSSQALSAINELLLAQGYDPTQFEPTEQNTVLTPSSGTTR